MTENNAEVEFGGQKILVPKGGYYDRFHNQPDLDEVAKDPRAGNIEFFRRIPKQKTASRVGLIWAPNFYYRSQMVQLLMTAPLSRLRAMLPEPLTPLPAYPGHGLVTLSFFSYLVCDNDPYNEVSVAVVIRRPGHRGSAMGELCTAMKQRRFHAHILALPVNTEIARVRGVMGYQLPKWTTPIDVRLDGQIRACISTKSGTPDLILSAPLPAFQTVPSQSRIGSNIMIHQLDGQWCQTMVQSNTLAFAQTLFPKTVTLQRHGGPMTDLLNGIGIKKMMRFDVVKDAQFVLNMPLPISLSKSFSYRHLTYTQRPGI